MINSTINIFETAVIPTIQNWEQMVVVAPLDSTIKFISFVGHDVKLTIEKGRYRPDPTVLSPLEPYEFKPPQGFERGTVFNYTVSFETYFGEPACYPGRIELVDGFVATLENPKGQEPPYSLSVIKNGEPLGSDPGESTPKIQAQLGDIVQFAQTGTDDVRVNFSPMQGDLHALNIPYVLGNTGLFRYHFYYKSWASLFFFGSVEAPGDLREGLPESGRSPVALPGIQPAGAWVDPPGEIVIVKPN